MDRSHKVDRKSPIPLYTQLVNDLMDKIQSGLLRPGDLIESEKELMQRYGVSRVTVRQALGRLRRDRLVVCRQGKGTFVAPARVEEQLVALQSFSEVMSSAGRASKTRIRSFGFVSPGDEVSESLRLSPGEQVLRIERLHVVDEQVMAYAIIHLPPGIGGQLTADEVGQQSIYSLLENKLGLELGQASQRMRAIAADKVLAGVFMLKPGDPLLWADRVTFSTAEQPVEKITFYYPADQYEFVVRLRRVERGTLWPRQ